MFNLPMISDEDKQQAVFPWTNQQYRKFIDPQQMFDPAVFMTDTTKHGCWIQFGGFRIYYGRCIKCGGVVTDRRELRRKWNNGGRWPAYCKPCQIEKDRIHNEQAKDRMRRVRTLGGRKRDWVEGSKRK